MRRSGLAATVLLTGLGFAHAAFAQTPPTAPANYAQSLPDVATEQETLGRIPGVAVAGVGDPDADATLAAIADLNQRGMAGLAGHEAALRKVLADMPRPFAREQVEGDRLVYRADSMADCVAFAATLGRRADGRRQFECLGNPYAAAAFYLGSSLNESGRYDEALAALDLGLEATPDSPALITERNASFFGLQRFDDALAAAKRGLEIPNLSPQDRARLLRNVGNALTELRRLDEAEQAYRESLQLEPDNALAVNELRYIAQLRRGSPAEPGAVFRPSATPPQTPP